MLKIYIYWHKCYFGHGDNDNRVNLEQVCSLNIEQSRLLQLYTRNTLSQPFNSFQSTGDNAKEMVIIRFNNSSLLAPKSCSTLPEVSKNISNDEEKEFEIGTI